MSPSVAATCSRSVSSSCSASSWWKTSARRLYDSASPALGAGGGTACTTLSCRRGEDMAAGTSSRCAGCYDIPRSGEDRLVRARWGIWLFVLLLACAAAGCGGKSSSGGGGTTSSTTTSGGKKIKVGLVTDIGGLN